MIKSWKRVIANSPVATENTQFSGRIELYTDEEDITLDNIKKVIEDNIFFIYENRQKCLMLKNYEKGLHPINQRKKNVREDINNKVTVNHSSQIVEFKKGFIFGNPLTYSQRAREDYNSTESNVDVTEEERITDNGVAILNEMMFEQNKGAKDLKLADDLFKCGVAYRLVMANDDADEMSAFKIYPLDAESTFVIRRNDVTKEVILAGTFVFKDSGEVVLGAYTKDKYYTITMNGIDDNDIDVTEEDNGIGYIPIIQYRNNDNLMGAFENTISIQNAIDTIQSDRTNGIAQFVQAILWFNNCKVDKGQREQLSKDGCIQTTDISSDKKAQIQWLTSQLDQANTQTIIDDMTGTLLEIAGVPDRETATGGNTGQAIMLSNGWHSAETQAQAFEELFRDSERDFLKVVLSIIKNNEKSSNIEALSKLTIGDIFCNFNRNRTDNLLTKTQGLQEMLTAGVHPRIAFSLCGLFSDSEQAYIDSEPYLGKWQYDDADVVDTEDTEIADDEEVVDDEGTTETEEQVADEENDKKLGED